MHITYSPMTAKIAAVVAANDCLQDTYQSAVRQGRPLIEVPRSAIRLVVSYMDEQPPTPDRNLLLHHFRSVYGNVDKNITAPMIPVETIDRTTRYVTDRLVSFGHYDGDIYSGNFH